MIINKIGPNVTFTRYIMLKLINDICSSNADYRDAKRTFCEADIFEFLNVDRLEVSFVNYTTGCTYISQNI